MSCEVVLAAGSRKGREMLRRHWLLVGSYLLIPTTLLVTGGVGCRQCGLWKDPCAEIPEGAIPAPAGTYNSAWQKAQADRADEDFFVFYQYEWRSSGEQLGPFGQRHLQRIVERLPDRPHQIVIEPSGDQELDQRRIAAIQAALQQQDAGWVGYPVVVAYPEAEHLYGFESRRVSQGFLGQGGGQGNGGQGGGGMGGGGGGMGGGMGGGGF